MPVAFLDDRLFDNQEEEVIRVFDALISRDYHVVIRESKSVQEYFHKMAYKNVAIYCITAKEKEPHNIGNWEECYLKFGGTVITRMGEFHKVDNESGLIESFDFMTEEEKVFCRIPSKGNDMFECYRESNVGYRHSDRMTVMDCINNDMNFFMFRPSWKTYK